MLVLMTNSLDANYETCCGKVYEWPVHENQTNS